MKIQIIIKNTLLLLGLSSFIGALVYYFYALNSPGLAITIFTVILLYFIILHFIPKDNTEQENVKNLATRLDRITLYLVLAFFVFALRVLLDVSTKESLLSPWQSVPLSFFVLLFFYILILLYQAKKDSKFFILSLSFFCFLIFSLAITVFPLGFGFDPFIHGATLDLIQENGAVEPKPLYYLGEYSLLTVLNLLPFTALKTIHYYLIPFLAALFLPFFFRSILCKWLDDNKIINYTILFLLILPLSIFTISTPQNLAWLFLILVVMFGIKCNNYRDLTLMLVLSFASLVTQAIAGLPALFLTGLLALHHSNLKQKKIYLGISVMAMSLILPLIFFFLSQGKLLFAKSSIFTNFSFLLPRNPNTENIFLNSCYFFINNIPLLILLLIIPGVFLAIKHKKNCEVLYIYLLSALAMLSSYLLLLHLDFAYLIDYEQTNFANRILITVVIFSLPFIILSLYKFFDQLNKQNIFVKNIFFIFLIILILFSVYGSFPRFDHYENSHSYSVGQNDIEAVNWIENDAKQSDCIVLANQQVSAAALHEFGFKKYYNSSNPIFYYPIPTGGPLYQYYLDMVYDYPAKETIKKAMDLTSVNTAYFVLNKYWWAYDKIFSEAKLEANSYHSINNEVIIFKYSYKSDSSF
ncbi:MAG: hypothetical protein U9Q85_03440 [Patescibacteria group bacterium]|nr:hypothetical protein [Patescibacteria group bacterium]